MQLFVLSLFLYAVSPLQPSSASLVDVGRAGGHEAGEGWGDADTQGKEPRPGVVQAK